MLRIPFAKVTIELARITYAKVTIVYMLRIMYYTQ